MYKKVKLDEKGFVGMEQKIAEEWKKNYIVKKNLDLNKGKEHFTFYDGPPTANGMPHAGHILTRVMKDIIPRYKVMQGYRVIRKAGWDTHGLPVELEIEKKLGISGKQQIEEYGVEKFVKECKESVFKYVSIWEEMTNKVAYWLDMDDPYITYKNEYIESVWWALKELWNKGLLYEGHKVMPYCPRCGTALSSHEVAQGYKDVKDLTCTVKFKVKDTENKYILAWTTTPWTLPSNLALCINKSYDYADVKVNVGTEEEPKYEIYVLAKELVEQVLKGKEYEIIKTYKGNELLGVKYEQLMQFVQPEGKAFEVIHGDYVTLTDGTGIVHIAPAYGEDDSLVSQKNGITFINLVDKEGKFVNEVTPWAGRFVRDCNEEICDWLEQENKLFGKEKHLHAYPHCWRCDTPLLYYPKESWFVAMTKLRKELVDNNNKVNWYPDTIRTGRFGNFLENIIDWGISRDRYWGTPLPIWTCEDEQCGHKECIGSIKELKEKGIDVADDIELHKPYIDDVYLKCPKCGKKMKRAKEVIDCWFDSGSMPFAQWHYPFENDEIFKNNFPAQYISEAIDQTRGWFYTLSALGTALFGKIPFENCIVLGHVLDGKGQKMSKSKGNGIDPIKLLDTVGADATRWYFCNGSAPWISSRLSLENVQESQRGFLSTLWNVYSFFVLYAEIDQFNPLLYKDFKIDNVMDKWIISKLNSLIIDIEEKLDNYDINGASSLIDTFTDNLSNWYVRRNRERFWKQELSDDKIGAYVTLHRVLVTLSKVIAPFVPFIAEEIHQNLVVNLDENAEKSVHLCKWPIAEKNNINKELEKEMDLAYKIVKLGRNARNSADIKNRQPLAEMLVSIKSIPEYYGNIIKDELNIKNIEFGAEMSEYVDFEIKPNLPVLGKEYGKLIPRIKEEISKMNQMKLASKINNSEEEKITIDGIEIILNSENLIINMKGKAGYAFSGEGELGVVLDTHITEELLEEGYVREVLSKIQNLRKESNFDVMDRIKIYLSGSEKVISIVKQNEATIKHDTLATEILYNKENIEYSEIIVNKETVNIMLEKI